ncbi:MAG: YdcF family protein [Leptospiraceae bacterium]|nr:YdcF family protein [Leptospiraceae bacterium]MDW8305782.1 YdcF family protein [Leptospiraceae bacterium]
MISLIYGLSIRPVTDLLLRPLEDQVVFPKEDKAEALVVLGGGVLSYSPSPFGLGIAESESLYRLLAALWLYRQRPRPIILSGGSVYANERSEAEVLEEMLVQLGVRRVDIWTDKISRTTEENIAEIEKILLLRNIRRIFLISSAFHLPRALGEFSHFRGEVIGYPSHYHSRDVEFHIWVDYLPRAKYLYLSSLALHEYLGLFFQWIKKTPP